MEDIAKIFEKLQLSSPTNAPTNARTDSSAETQQLVEQQEEPPPFSQTLPGQFSLEALAICEASSLWKVAKA